MGWAKNGEKAGSAGYSYRLEAIQIVLVDKNGSAPGNTSNAFQEQIPKPVSTPVQTSQTNTYILNTRTGKFHRSLSCSGLNQAYSSNLQTMTATREYMLSHYSACKDCKP